MSIRVRLGDFTFNGSMIDYTGFTLTALTGWDDLPDAKTEQDSWTTQDGNATPGTTLYDGRSITIEGYYLSSSSAQTETMMRRLRSLAGRMTTIYVDKGNGEFHAPVEIRGISVDESRYRGGAVFQISLLSPSSYQYGPSNSKSTSVRTGSGGMEEPLVEPLSEGDVGEAGFVVITGSGYAPTSISINVTGNMTDGVKITHVEENAVLELAYPIHDTDTVTFDYDTRRVIINNQSDITGYLKYDEWTNPTGEATFLFSPLVNTTSDVRMTVTWMEAYR